jgi:Ca2+-binding EF-hand superfamily protein
LSEQEWKNFIKALDENSDGVLTLDEWTSTLSPKISFEAEF